MSKSLSLLLYIYIYIYSLPQKSLKILKNLTSFG